MKNLIVYYSMNGNTDYVAQKMSSIINADLLRIYPKEAFPDKGFKKFFWGGKSAVMGETPELEEYIFNSDIYDHIIIGTPIWAGTMAPPIRTFIVDNKNKLVTKKISVYCTHSGGGGVKAIRKIKELLGEIPLENTLEVVEPKDKPSDESELKITEFCDKFHFIKEEIK